MIVTAIERKDLLFAVVASKFHGGGILYKSRSPRQVWRWLRRHHDGCFDGDGCEHFAASLDGGESWYHAYFDTENIGCISYHYRDVSLYVDIDRTRQIRTAAETLGATEPAL